MLLMAIKPYYVLFSLISQLNWCYTSLKWRLFWQQRHNIWNKMVVTIIIMDWEHENSYIASFTELIYEEHAQAT